MRAVIWDFNGVVIDDEDIHGGAFAAVLAELGLELSLERYYARYLGLDDRGFFRAALADLRGSAPAADEVDALVERKADAYAALLPADFALIDGAEALIRSTAAAGPIAIASGARRREIEAVLARFDLASCFTAVVSADEVEHGKPDPEGYRKAWQALAAVRAGLAAADCLVIEDAPPGIRAAHAAGMRCVAVATSRTRAELGEAEAVVDTLVGLDAHRLWQLVAAPTR